MVRHIVWYIRNFELCKYGSIKINIKDEVTKFKEAHPGVTPVVIFDLMPCITMLIEDGNELLCGGYQNECTRRGKEICQKFNDLGVKMVFFMNGPVKTDNLSNWIDRANRKYEFNSKVFEAIKNNETPVLKFSGQILTTYVDNFLKIAEQFGEVFVPLQNKKEIDITIYANKLKLSECTKLLALFTCSSDFLMMPGDWRIWSPFSFNIERFSSYAWNKIRLRASLHLNQKQMPIFATLMGNDFVPHEMIKHIHEIYREGVIQKEIADFVNRHFIGVPLSNDDFNKLINFIYDNGKNEYKLEEIEKSVKRSLDFYSVKENVQNCDEPLWLKNHIEETKSSIVYIIMKDLPFSINQSYIDLSKNDVLPYAELVLPLFRRQLGIVLYKQRNDDIQRKVCFKPSHEEPFQIHSITPVYPDTDIPDITDLLRRNSEVTDQDRFRILAWAIPNGRKKLEFSLLLEICHSTFLIPAMVLNYLVKKYQITIDEADIVLLSIQKAITTGTAGIEPVTTYKERPFWIVSVYTQIIFYFSNAFIICGLKDYIKLGCFDGRIFHRLYSEYLLMTHEEKKKHLCNIQKFRLYVK